MDADKIGAVVQFGLDYERTRVEVASRNLAVADVALAPGAKAGLQRVGVKGSFAGMVGIPQVDVQAQQVAVTRDVYDPGNPLADGKGMVHYPKVDPAVEMATLVSATRAYEADIRAYNTLDSMARKAFEIGK